MSLNAPTPKTTELFSGFDVVSDAGDDELSVVLESNAVAQIAIGGHRSVTGISS